METKSKNKNKTPKKEVKVIVKEIKQPKKRKSRKEKEQEEKMKQEIMAELALVDKLKEKNKSKIWRKAVQLKILKDNFINRSPHLINLKELKKEAARKAERQRFNTASAKLQQPFNWFKSWRRKRLAPQFVKPHFSSESFSNPLIKKIRVKTRSALLLANGPKLAQLAAPARGVTEKVIPWLFYGLWRLIKTIDRWIIKRVQDLGFFLWKIYKSSPHFIKQPLYYFARFLEATGRAIEIIWQNFIKGPHSKGEMKRDLKSAFLIFRPRPIVVWYRTVIGFIIVALLLVLPIYLINYYQKLHQTGYQVLDITKVALERLKSGGEASINLDLNSANEEFTRAWQGFDFAQEQLSEINQVILEVLKLIPKEGEMVAAGEKLLSVGKDISLAGRYLANGLKPILKEGQVDLSVIMPVTEADNSSADLFLTDKIINLKNNFILADQKISAAEKTLSTIKISALPKEYQSTLMEVKNSLKLINSKIEAFYSFTDFLTEILGHEQTKRYLLIFQNNSELRPSGGFIGSFALIDIDRGNIKNIEIPGGGPYDLKAGFYKNLIAPEPLQLVNPRWELQDANWFPDFPASAEKIIWFYNKSGGPSVDGLIAFTPQLIEKLIGLVGPIDMTEKYKVVIDKNNFINFTQTEAEKKYNETRTSKQFIADLTPKVLSKALKGEGNDYLGILKILNDSLKDKSLLFYFPKKDLETEIKNYGWAGEIKEAPGDYLAINHANIAGGKTDTVMAETVNHSVEIDKQGVITDTLTITREHQGVKDDPFTGFKNIDYLRVYVPSGSELLYATGFLEPAEGLFQKVPDEYEVDQDLAKIQGEVKIDTSSQTRINNEFGKTVFGNWVQTEVGETSIVTLKYRLLSRIPLEKLRQPHSWWDNFKISLGIQDNSVSYSLLLQKQPGSRYSQFNHQVQFDFKPQIIWRYPADYQKVKEDWQASTEIDSDKFFALVFKE